MRILSNKSFSSPSFFYINVEFNRVEEFPLELLERMYRDHFQIMYHRLNTRLHLVQINQSSVRLICSCDEDFCEEKIDKVKDFIGEVSEKVFSNFDPEIKTPIGIQWELI
jgi:hypothetical protein